MKKCVLFAGMWSLTIIASLLVAFILDATVLSKNGQPGVATIILFQYLFLWILFSGIPAFFLVRWFKSPEK